MKKKLKAGIIGLGVGEQHIEGYQKHPGCEVTAICDFSQEKLKKVGDKYQSFRQTTNSEDILNDPDIDVVSIASYDNYHYEQIVKAIENKKHIFVEKPLCLYENEAQHIYTLLKINNEIKLSSNLILRMSPRFRRLKKMIAAGEMGNIFHIEGDYNYGRLFKITEGWRGKIDFYSVIYGGGVHIIDLICWLVDDEIIDVAAYGNNIASKGTAFRFNDMVVSIMKFKNGMSGKISANFGCIHPHFHSLSVYGTKATFQNGKDFGLFFESCDTNIQPQKITDPYPGTHKGDLINSFLDSIITGDTYKAEVAKHDVFKTMSVCFAMEKAASEESFIKVNPFK